MTNEVSFECLKPHERDFFVSRICCGYYYFELGGETLKFTHPDKHVTLQAHEIYFNSFATCFQNTISEQQILELIIAEHNWKYEDEEILEEFPTKSKDIKIDIFKNMYNPIVKMRLKKQLKELESEYYKRYNIKNSFHYMTPTGIAESHKWCFLVNQCIVNSKNEKQSYNMQKSKMVVNLVLEKYITDIMLRDIVKAEPWSSLWFASGGRNLFNGDPCDYTSEQIRVINWSRMYDNIRKSHNPPSEDVIDDDDALDGWMAITARERDKERNLASAESKLTNKRIKGSQEVFIPVSSREEAKRVQNLNTESNKTKQKEMIEKLKGS